MKKFLYLLMAAFVLMVACNKEKVIPLTGISLDYEKALIALDGNFTLTAKLAPANATIRDISWRTESPEVATVEDGVVTPLQVGTAIIVAESGDLSASCEVTVCELTFNPSTTDVAVDRSLPLSLFIRPEVPDLGDVIWTSDHPEIASVEDGIVTGKSMGTVTITATAGVNLKAVCDVGVYRIIYEEDFENKERFDSQWTVVDADGDGYKWKHLDNTGLTTSQMMPAHSGVCSVCSESYINFTMNEDSKILTPDNWMFSPSVHLSNGTNFLSYWVGPEDNRAPSDKYAVYVASNTSPGEHYMLFQETLVSTSVESGVGYFHRVLPIPDSFKGQSVHFAFRHYDCTDAFVMKIDDVCVAEGNMHPEPAENKPASSVSRPLNSGSRDAGRSLLQKKR